MSPLISGGGNTTAQVVASGKVLPVADPSGVIIDTTTYTDPVHGGLMTVLVFPSGFEGVALAIANAGDAFPRYIFGNQSADGISFGTGSYDAYNSGGPAVAVSGGASGKMLRLSANGQVATLGGVTTANQGQALALSCALVTEGGEAIRSGTGTPTIGGEVGDIYIRDNGPPHLYRCTVAGTSGNATWVPVLTPGSPVGIITSGALPTVQLVSGTGARILTTRDAETHTPVTFNPGVATTATVAVELSPDNVTYSTLAVATKPVGTVFDGEIDDLVVRVPAGWYLKLTVNAQATLGLTTYY